jgi:hypothetical protein
MVGAVCSRWTMISSPRRQWKAMINKLESKSAQTRVHIEMSILLRGQSDCRVNLPDVRCVVPVLGCVNAMLQEGEMTRLVLYNRSSG